MSLAEAKVARLNPLLRALTILGLAALSCNLSDLSPATSSPPPPEPTSPTPQPLPCNFDQWYPPNYENGIPSTASYELQFPEGPGCHVVITFEKEDARLVTIRPLVIRIISMMPDESLQQVGVGSMPRTGQVFKYESGTGHSVSITSHYPDTITLKYEVKKPPFR